MRLIAVVGIKNMELKKHPKTGAPLPNNTFIGGSKFGTNIGSL